MRFDRFSEKDFASKTLPDGHHEVEIVKVRTVVSTKSNNEFCVIRFQDVGDSFDAVDAWLNPDNKRHTKSAMDLNAALGRPWDSEIDKSIEGRRVTIVSKRAFKDGDPVLDQDGNQRVYINGYLPALSDRGQSAETSASRPAARTPLQKADAAAAANDDIPF